MKSRRTHQQEGYSHGQILRFGASALVIGFLLFLHVYWPIQAERTLLLLGESKSKLSQKKSELNLLQEKYSSLTSLHVLDQWAAKHGPWRSPGANDIIVLPS